MLYKAVSEAGGKTLGPWAAAVTMEGYYWRSLQKLEDGLQLTLPVRMDIAFACFSPEIRAALFTL